MASAWMVRSGKGGARVDEFISHRVVAIGWSEIESDLTGMTQEAIYDLLVTVFPNYHPSAAANAASMLYRLTTLIAEGDTVITYDSERRIYHIGTVTGPYRYQPQLIDGLPHTRAVAWDREVSRDVLASATRNTLGSTLTLFRVLEEPLADLLRENRNLPVRPEAAPVNETSNLESVDDTAERSVELIKDMVMALEPEEMQELLASLLRAMGYKARVSPKGPDRGVDVVASRDGLGLEAPRIKAEVKHRSQTQMDAPEIRNFIATLRPGDSGLYLSTGGFTREARYEAERANVSVTLIAADDLVKHITDNYARFDDRGRALVPLVPVWWPAKEQLQTGGAEPMARQSASRL